MTHDTEQLVSVIVTTRNSEATLERLLKSVHHQSHRYLEILVVDNFSDDSTIKIAQQHGCKVLLAGPERSAQRNAGARIARGDLLLFLDSDMELTPGLVHACVERARRAHGLCLREITIGNNYWAKVRALEHSRYFRSGIFEAARCFQRSVFRELDGYDPMLTGLEDYDLQARFLKAGFVLGWVEIPLLHHEEGVNLRNYLQKRRYYRKTDAVYALKHPGQWRKQRSPATRLRWIFRNPFGISDIPLLPGLLVMRGLEWLIRDGRGN